MRRGDDSPPLLAQGGRETRKLLSAGEKKKLVEV
jgi:hypothetical protein